MYSPRAIGSVLVVAWVAAFAGSAMAQRQSGPPAPPAVTRPRPLLGDETDGSRARPVHRIPLHDAEDQVISPGDVPLLPFSPSNTCAGACHNVQTISRGWHFRTGVAGSPGGRRGEPWILIDPDTATQIPLSNHSWPGTFTPAQIGLSPWQFAARFGGRTPGGLDGRSERRADLQVRWAVSGELAPNCLACHDASAAYDHAEYARQIGLENFRWAAAAASGLATVSGAARDMPNTFDYLMPRVEDDLSPRVPSVAYAGGRFLPDGKVVFDIAREVPSSRCYFCHTTVDVAHTRDARWGADVDVHMARGMSCVDCHRNGLDHEMTRGYEGDPALGAPGAATLTCRGCHLATEPDRVFASGRMGAPTPRHEGLPPVHFQKLSCTACHSGPQPEPSTRRVKTSLAHRLGGQNVNKADDALPHLYYPVFAREDGVIVPNRLLWPAFWGAIANGVVAPIAIDRVKAAMTKGKVALARAADGSWSNLDPPTIGRILAVLQNDLQAGATAAYFAGGEVHRLENGRVVAGEHASAKPYLWPIAHDVRPASASLGARGCQECHDGAAPIFVGQVAVDSPIAGGRAQSWEMSRFQPGLDAAHVASFARTFRYRTWMKVAVVSATGLLILFVAGYVTPAMRRLSVRTMTARRARVAANIAAAVACGAAVLSGLPALLSGGTLTGRWLLVHVAAGPVFLVGAIMAMFFWAARSRFETADWRRLRRPWGAAATRSATTYVALVSKVAFWVASVAVIPAGASVALSLFPVVASVWQLSLLSVHRTSTAVFVAAAAIFVVATFIGWMRDRVDATRASGEAAPGE